MDVVHAISKVRFASARPQSVRLGRTDSVLIEMLCMEPGQETKVTSGRWVYYVVTGSARFTTPAGATELSAGQMALTGPDEKHTVSNAGEERLVCLVVGPTG